MTQGLRTYFSPILNTVIQSLDAQPVFMRTKALKALGQIITSDPEILSAVSEWLGSLKRCSLYLVEKRATFDRRSSTRQLSRCKGCCS